MDHPYNHHEYCPGCYEVVMKALSKVPAKYEKKFVPSQNYTREQIVEHQEERCKEGLPFRRIMPCLYDMTGKTRHMIVCEQMPDGEWYKAEWWSHEPENVSVGKETWVPLF